MKIIPASDSSLLVVFGNAISHDLHDRVMALFHALHARNDPRIRNLHPGYASILIDFDPLGFCHQDLAALVGELLDTAPPKTRRTVTIVRVPVCYDLEFGPDLLDVANYTGRSPEEVIRLHSSAIYLVYFVGFSPGYGYLGGLPEQLQMPRLDTPRKLVAAGTVGIAGSQTGIYPVDSPGGWRLIGRTPLRLFDPAATPPTLLAPGDLVQFCPIDRPAFSTLAQAH